MAMRNGNIIINDTSIIQPQLHQFDTVVGDTINLLLQLEQQQAAPQERHPVEETNQEDDNEMTDNHDEEGVIINNNNNNNNSGVSLMVMPEDISFVTPDPARLIALGANATFPWRLHCLLNDAKTNGFDYLVDWQLDGRGFKVFNQQEFTNKIIPNYFNQSKYKSFQRQLNMYGFVRIAWGVERGTYCHPLFIRGQPDLSIQMKRAKKKTAATMKCDINTERNVATAVVSLPSAAAEELGNDNEQKRQAAAGASAPNATNKIKPQVEIPTTNCATSFVAQVDKHVKLDLQLSTLFSQGNHQERTGGEIMDQQQSIKVRPVVTTSGREIESHGDTGRIPRSCFLEEPIPLEEEDYKSNAARSAGPHRRLSASNSLISRDSIFQEMLDVLLSKEVI